MGINYTEDQLKVINTRDRNILVSAAAGSGKTAVLVQRIIKMIIDEDKPIDINRLLVVTFTKAAAKEMKDRIRSTLEGMLKENPSDDNISRQLSLLYEAQITTIDAFCQQVVKEHFSSIDLDPEFRVADEAELSLMKNDVLDEILEERFEEGDKDFLEFIDAYTTPSNNNKVREVIFSVYDYSRSMDKPEVWLHKCIEAFSYDNEDELINSAYFAEYMNLASWDIEELKTLISENLWIGSVGGVDEYFDNARADADLISTLINAKFEDNGKNRDETTLKFDGKSEKYYTLYTEEIKENPIIHFFKKIFNIGDTSSNIKEIRKKIIVTIDNANKSWSRLKLSKNSSSDLYLQIKFKENRDKIKKIVAGLSKSALFQPTEDILEGMEISKIYAKTLVSIVEDLSSKFSESKKAKGIIDFSDMERYALEILTEKQYRKNAYDNQEEKYEDSQLTNVDFDNGKEVIDNIEIEEKYKDNYILQPSTIAKEYEEYYEEILIDEYQDSNFLQEAILSSFARKKEDGFKNNMFMVGDVKQSIYGFRRAKPELFIEKYNRFTENSNEEMRIDLHKNFRSSEAVVNSVNMIFKRIMGKDLGGIDYDDRASLILGVDSIFTPEENENQTELLLINEKDMTLEEPDIDELNKSEMEGRVIADKIEKVLLETKVYDKNTKSYRKAMFGDIVILLRSLGELGDTIEKTLNDRGIPAIMPRKTGFSETPEIMVLTNYLRVLNNRYDDLSLTSLLTSVLCGLSDNELAKIKIFGKDETPHEFFQDVYRYAQMGEDKTIVGKLQGLLEVMDEIDQISMDLSTSELLGEILNKTNYYQLISLMPGGRQRVANVESFVEKAKNFERSGYKGLFNLIRFIDKMDKVQNDQGETNILDESIDAVRIMTIHKSKGLEFPIVFVSGLGKEFNVTDLRKTFILSDKYGMGFDPIDLKERIEKPSLIKELIKDEKQDENLAEDLRVLYVALTRAKEKLIMTGTIGSYIAVKKDKKKGEIQVKDNISEMIIEFNGENAPKVLPLSYKRSARRYLDFILPAVLIDEEKSKEIIKITRIEKDEIGGEEEGIERINEALDLERVQNLLKCSSAGFGNYETIKNLNSNSQLNNEEHDIYNSLNYEYSFSEDKKMKYTVTELKRLHKTDLGEVASEEEFGEALFANDVEEKVVPYIPRFVAEEENTTLTGANRGTAYHRIVELLDFSVFAGDTISDEIVEDESINVDNIEQLDLFSYVESKDLSNDKSKKERSEQNLESKKIISEIKRQIKSFLEKGLISRDEANSINLEDIATLILSTVGERLIRADVNGSLHKEQPFVVELEGVLVQGVIDAYFEEDGKYIILDYKTDRLDTPEEFAERYKIQLDYYKKALEQITEKEVSETMIYSFRLGRGIKMSDKKYFTPEEVMGENWEEGLDEVEDEWE